MTRRNDQSEYLRGRLANVGIMLDDPKIDVSKPSQGPARQVEPDRERIREILIAAGAPEHDMDWLLASCPSIDAARTYTPPRKPEQPGDVP